MRTSRSILYTALGTVLCLFYVFQQTEIVKLGYRITRAQDVLQACLDHKTSLEYTVSSLESPHHFDKTIFSDKESFEMPQSYKLVKLDSRRNTKNTVQPVAAATRFAFLSFFTGKIAEAKTVK